MTKLDTDMVMKMTISAIVTARSHILQKGIGDVLISFPYENLSPLHATFADSSIQKYFFDKGRRGFMFFDASLPKAQRVKRACRRMRNNAAFPLVPDIATLRFAYQGSRLLHYQLQPPLAPPAVTVIVTVTKLVGPNDGKTPAKEGATPAAATPGLVAPKSALITRACEFCVVGVADGAVVLGTNAVVPIA